MTQKKILYESWAISSSSETEIYQEGDKVVFAHCSETDETEHNDSFHIEVDVCVYKKAVDELLKTGMGVLVNGGWLPNGFIQTRITLEKHGNDLVLIRGLDWFVLVDFDFDKLVL